MVHYVVPIRQKLEIEEERGHGYSKEEGREKGTRKESDRQERRREEGRMQEVACLDGADR